MKANPGGKLTPEAIVGRDKIIDLIWETLDQQSIIKTAERRIGKTSIAQKMRLEPRKGWLPVFQDLEQYHTANDFAMSVYHEVDQFLSGKKRATRRVKEFFKEVKGTEIGGTKLPELSPTDWKDVLTCSIEDLIKDREESEEQLLFLWDEMPYMLEHIRDREGEEVALEILDVLRSLRQEHGLRMVITGSVGIHHVLKTLSTKAETTINDLFQIEIPTLTPFDAADLARRLLDGEQVHCDDVELVAGEIAKETDNFPFYIHHVVKALKMNGGMASAESVRSIIAQHLTDDNDPWNLDHFRQRLGEYYGVEETVVCQILDELSVSQSSISPNDLLTLLKNLSATIDRDQMLRLLKLLARDHYLKRDVSGEYSFRFTLIKRWWAISRGL